MAGKRKGKKGGVKNKSAVRRQFLKNNALYSYKKYISATKTYDATTVLADNTWTEVKTGTPGSFVGMPTGTTDLERMNQRITQTGLMLFAKFTRQLANKDNMHLRIMIIKERTRDGNHVNAADLPKWSDGHGDAGTGQLVQAPHSIISGKKYQILYDKIWTFKSSDATANQDFYKKKKFSYIIPQRYTSTDRDDEAENRISLWVVSDEATSAAELLVMHWISFYVDNLA